MTLKVAIVGCGKIADGHVEEIQKMPEKATVVAVCDLELLMAEQLAVRYGVRRHYDDFERMLTAERPDVVHVTTPPGSHLPLAMRAIDAGAHVYVEKPLTPSYGDSKRLVDYALAAKRKLTIGYSYLFDPPALAMRDLVREGVLGDPVHVDAVYGYNLAGPFGSAILGDGAHWVHRLPGKLFHNNIDHLLYKLPEFFDPEGGPSSAVTDPLAGLTIAATGYRRRSQRFEDARDDMLDELRFMVTGRGVSASGVFSSHIKPVAHFTRIYGTRNTILVDYVMRTVTLGAEPSLPSAIGRLVPAFEQGLQFLREGGKNVVRFLRSDFHYFSGLNRLFYRFYESIVSDGPPPIRYRDILTIAAMMDEIFRQVPQGEGRRVA